MEVLLKAVLLSILPISELRGGIPLAIGLGVSPLKSFIFCILANIIIVIIFYFILNYLHRYLVKIKFYSRVIESSILRSRKKLEHRIGTRWEYIFLCLFVAVPLPLTGGYSGMLIAWFFELNKKKSIIAVSLGVLIAGIIVTLASIGLFSIFKI